jgi:hypothetical protein
LPPVVDVPASYESESGNARKRRSSEKPEWGIHAHLSGSILGGGAAPNSGMGGLGLALRYRPVPHFAVQGGPFFARGRDWSGAERTEAAVLGHALVFFNPKDKFQLFTILGLGWASASIGQLASGQPGPAYNYEYLGAQFGAGAEWRLAKSFALYGDVRGFVRGRVDGASRTQPEFVDPSGRATNSSGGGLFSGGMTIYW